MAQSFTCDGCGKPVAEPKKVGYVLRRDYCAECAVIAGSFTKEEEEARIAIQAAFATKRAELIAKHGANGFKLPDVP